MSLITSSTLHNPVKQYALIDRQTDRTGSARDQSRVDSVRKNYGFRWKGLGVEYQVQDIHVAPRGEQDKKFYHAMREAMETRKLSGCRNHRHYGPVHPGSAAKAYAGQWQARLEYTRPMINLSI